MRIAMDTREAHSSTPTGKGLLAKNILLELAKRHTKITEYHGRGWQWHLQTAHSVKQSGYDVYLSPTSFIVPWLLGTSVPTAIIIHDLIAFDREPHDRKAKLIERLLLPRVLKTAHFIFCVSKATKTDLLKKFPKTDTAKITVIYEGPTMTERGTRNEERGTPYILSLGTLCPRKNQLRLIQAFNSLPTSLKLRTKLILAGGRGWQDEEIVTLAKTSQNVKWRGYVPTQELDSLFAHATVLAFPSLKEGFGLPVLDAMTLGVPVLTSNLRSMSEIAGDAALLVDPESTEDIAKGLQRLLLESDLRAALIHRGKERAKLFSWERTVDFMMKAMQKY